MRTNRHVPMITGVVALGLAFLMLVGFSGWWKYIPAIFFLMFGWGSIKTALFASSQEISELTGSEPMSEKTRKKFEDRI